MKIRVAFVAFVFSLGLAASSVRAERSSGGASTDSDVSRSEVVRASEHSADHDALPDAFKKPPYSKQSLSVGSPNHGRLVRGRKLPHELAVKLLKATNERSFAHPILLRALTHGAKSVRQKFPGSVLQVVELSSKDGGVIPQKRSHQSGRDADVLFYSFDKKGKRAPQKKLVHFDGSGKATDGSGIRFDDERNWAFLETLANQKDSPVTHVFVDARLRQRLLSFAEGAERKPERIARVAAILFVGDSSEPSDAYFHLRVRCPANQSAVCDENPH